MVETPIATLSTRYMTTEDRWFKSLKVHVDYVKSTHILFVR